MHLIQVTPHPCVLCGKGNVPRNDGEPNVFVDLERDVNWNDPVILCEDCATKVGAIVGMLDPAAKAEFEDKLAEADRRYHELEAEMDALRGTMTNARKRPTSGRAAA